MAPAYAVAVSSSSASRRSWPWFPILSLLLAAGGIAWVRTSQELERNFQLWLSLGIPILVLGLNTLWFIFSSRFSWRLRLWGLAGLLLLMVGLAFCTRVDGTIDGRGWPRVVWRWSVREAPALGNVTPTAEVKIQADPALLAKATDVPQFFGPNRDGRIFGAKLARDWKQNPPKELWRQPIGLGWSAYAVVKGRGYTQEQREEEELVTCYDLFTGKLVWAHADKARFSQWQSGDGPHATPAVHEGYVYAYGGTGLLTCLDAATGKKIWQRSVLAENNQPNNEWGISASPVIVDDKVVVTGGDSSGSVLFAYLLKDGELAWKAGADRASYASPSVVTLAGKRVVLSNNGRALLAVEPATGKVLLEHGWGVDQWAKASQPLVLDQERVFLSAGYGMGCQMLKITAQEDGSLAAEELWAGMKMKTQFNSVAERDGHAYGLDDGRLACMNLETGERLWKEGRFASGQTLLVDDLVLIQNENGSVHLAAAQPSGFEEFGQIKALSSRTWNHPTLAGRYLLVRNDREAVCYELPVQD